MNRWRGRDIPDEQRGEYLILQRRKESLAVQLSRDLSSGLLPRAEWSALIKVLSLRGGVFPEQLITGGVRESLLRKEFIQLAFVSVSGEGEDSSTDWSTFTAAAISYWQRNRYRHHNVHPDINSDVSPAVMESHAWRSVRAEAAARAASGRGFSGAAVMGSTYPG